MCLAFVLALILLPLFAGGIGYARYGAAGGAIGALGGLARRPRAGRRSDDPAPLGRTEKAGPRQGPLGPGSRR
ncbi:MAG: hypothetical protein WDM92_08250 [Caulobacteraceae bacterium]